MNANSNNVAFTAGLICLRSMKPNFADDPINGVIA